MAAVALLGMPVTPLLLVRLTGWANTQAFGAIRIVGAREQTGAHHVRRDREHQGGLGVIGVPILAVGEMDLAHARAERCRIEQRDHQVVMLGPQHFQRAAQMAPRWSHAC